MNYKTNEPGRVHIPLMLVHLLHQQCPTNEVLTSNSLAAKLTRMDFPCTEARAAELRTAYQLAVASGLFVSVLPVAARLRPLHKDRMRMKGGAL